MQVKLDCCLVGVPVVSYDTDLLIDNIQLVQACGSLDIHAPLGRSSLMSGRLPSFITPKWRRHNPASKVKSMTYLLGKQVSLTVQVSGDYNVCVARSNDIREDGILNWLSPVTFRASHLDTAEQHYPGTSSWVTASNEFGQWLQGDAQLIWLNGARKCIEPLGQALFEDTDRIGSWHRKDSNIVRSKQSDPSTI